MDELSSFERMSFFERTAWLEYGFSENVIKTRPKKPKVENSDVGYVRKEDIVEQLGDEDDAVLCAPVPRVTGLELNNGTNPVCVEDRIYASTDDRDRVIVLTSDGKWNGFAEVPRHVRECCGVAVSGEDLFVIDARESRVLVINRPKQSLVREFGGSESREYRLRGPVAITVADGLVFVLETDKNRVAVFDVEGRFVRHFGHGDTEEGLNEPASVVVCRGEVFIADSGNHRIAVYRARDGAFLGAMGSFGDGPGQLSWPSGVCVHEDLVLVADRGNNRVVAFAREDGSYVGHLDAMALSGRVRGVCVSGDGRLHVTGPHQMATFRPLFPAWHGADLSHQRASPRKRREVVAVLSLIARTPDGCARYVRTQWCRLPLELVELCLKGW